MRAEAVTPSVGENKEGRWGVRSSIRLGLCEESDDVRWIARARVGERRRLKSRGRVNIVSSWCFVVDVLLRDGGVEGGEGRFENR